MSFRFIAAIAHPCEPRVLLLPAGETWSLPEFNLEGLYPGSTEAINRAVSERIGTRVYTVRHLAWGGSNGAGRPWVCAFEASGAERTRPDGGRWADRRDLEILDLAGSDRKGTDLLQPGGAEPDHPGPAGPGSDGTGPELTGHELRELADRWLTEIEKPDKAPQLRPTWARGRWLDGVERWVDDRLAEQGIGRTGPLDQTKCWSISCLYRIPTTAGRFYFKAVPPLFAGEPRITRELSLGFPDWVPRVAAIDEERSWLLMPEFDGSPLPEDPEDRVWEEALNAFARIQIACAGRAADLLAWGCADRRLHTLADQFDRLLDELRSPEARASYDVAEDRIELLAAVRPRIREQCEDLAARGVPETLLHGDLHSGNIVIRDGRPLFYDWTDAALSHPFFDLLTIAERGSGSEQPSDMVKRARLHDAYFEPWSTFAPTARLREAYEISRRLAPAYHAISYRNIAMSTEPLARPELAGAVGYYLRRLLDEADPRNAADEGLACDSTGS